MQRFRRRSYQRRAGREGGRENEGEGATGDQLGSSDGTGQEVGQWQSEDGRAVSGEVNRRLGRKRVVALMQGPEQGVRSRVAALNCSCPHLQASRGLLPQPIGRGLMPMPHFLSSAAWDQLHPVERERAGKWERDFPCPCPVPAPAHAPQGSGSKSKGLPAPAASLTAPRTPQPSPNLLFSSSLQRRPLVVIIFFFLI